MKSLVTESLNSIHRSANEGLGSMDKAAYQLSSNVDTTPIVDEIGRRTGITIEPFQLEPRGIERAMTRLDKTDITDQCDALMKFMFRSVTIGGAWCVTPKTELADFDDDDDSLLIYVRVDLSGTGEPDDEYDGYSTMLLNAYSADGQTWEFRE